MKIKFAEKSEADRKSLFADMLLSPILHTDCTNAKVNGKLAWNKEMQEFLREVIHERKQLPPETNFSEEQTSQYEARYK